MLAEDLTDDAKRKLHIAWAKRLAAVIEEQEKLWEKWKADMQANPHKQITRPVLPEYPPCPPETTDLKCGAKTRAGTPCKRKDLYDNGRCRLHGGLSTGPVTEEGKKRAAMNGLKRKKNNPDQ